jgi:enoyl-CoA hydratase/carnithine racemase
MTVDAAVRQSLQDGLLTVTLDRGGRRNAMTRAMAAALIEAFDRADADQRVRAVIVTGTAEAFCAGADLSGGADTLNRGSHGEQDRRDFGGVLALRIFASTKPVLAAISGDAVGVGATMTLPMDVRLAAPHARIGFVFPRLGIVPESCSSWFLPRLVGPSTAMQWMISGRLVGAAEARSAGLISSVHESEQLLPAAIELAHSLVDRSAPVSVALTRRLIWQGLTLSHPMQSHVQESRVLARVLTWPDAREGITAFRDRRRAEFRTDVAADVASFDKLWNEPAYPIDADRSP